MNDDTLRNLPTAPRPDEAEQVTSEDMRAMHESMGDPSSVGHDMGLVETSAHGTRCALAQVLAGLEPEEQVLLELAYTRRLDDDVIAQILNLSPLDVLATRQRLVACVRRGFMTALHS